MTKKDLQTELEDTRGALQSAETEAGALAQERDAADARLVNLRAAFDAVVQKLDEQEQQLEEQETELNTLREEREEWKRRVERAYSAGDRVHKRAAATNKRNAELQKALRASEYRTRVLQLQIDADVYNIRRVKLLSEQVELIRSVANTPTDDYVGIQDDVPLKKLLGKGH
jgi:chromosome segregation ATPase